MDGYFSTHFISSFTAIVQLHSVFIKAFLTRNSNKNAANLSWRHFIIK